MAELTSKSRERIPSSKFGLPGERKYPMPDKAHAANAKARATQMVNKGKLSMAAKKKIDTKANKVLGAHHKQMMKHHEKMEHHHEKLEHHRKQAEHHAAKMGKHLGGKATKAKAKKEHAASEGMEY